MNHIVYNDDAQIYIGHVEMMVCAGPSNEAATQRAEDQIPHTDVVVKAWVE